MPVKNLKPITPGTRWRIDNSYTEVTTHNPEKSLLVNIKSKAGRNNQGRMTMRYRGSGNKRQYRIIDFRRDKFKVPGVVKTIEYDPYRSCFISLIQYKDGEKRYIITPKGLKVGDKIFSGEKVSPDLGNALKIKNIPLGTIIHNIELNKGQGGILVRSAGASAQLNSKEEKYAVIKMPSGELRKIPIDCMATVGQVSNSDHFLQSYGKAGKKRWLGIRPRTRPVAMNPVDHPMGGGEGRASGGHPRSRKGLIAKGLKTRNKNKFSSKLIIQSRKSKK